MRHLTSFLALATSLTLVGCSTHTVPEGPETLVAEIEVLHREIWDHVERGGTGQYRLYDVRFGPALHALGESAHSGGMLQIAPAGTPARPGVYSVGISPDRSRLGIAATDGVSCVHLSAVRGVPEAPVVGGTGPGCRASGIDTSLDDVGDGWPWRATLEDRELSASWERLEGEFFARLVCSDGRNDLVVEIVDPAPRSARMMLTGTGSWVCQIEAHTGAGVSVSALEPLLIP